MVRILVRNRALVRLETAFAGFCMAEWATWVAIMVFAYQRGGATEAGAVAVVQLVPSALVAPFASSLGDRHPRARFLVWGYASQAATMGATGAAMAAGAPVGLVFALAAMAATSVTLTRPGQGAILPELSATIEELTAANVAGGAIESIAFFAGPAVAGALMSAWAPGAVFVGMAGVMACSSILATTLPSEGSSVRPVGGSLVSETLGGFRSLAGDGSARLVVGLTAGQSLVIGALDVLMVVLALTMLRLGSPGAGYLTSALGAGGIVGSMTTMALVGRRRLSPALALGALALSVPVAAIGLAPGRVVAVAMVTVAGAGRVLLDVSGRTLLQRLVPDHVLTRVFGVLEGVYMAALALGSLIAAGLVAALGPRGALVATGSILPVVVALAWPRLMRVEAMATAPPSEHLELLRGVPMFAPLSPPTLERLAANLVPVEVPAGTVILRHGEPGDRFYVIADGEVGYEAGGQMVAPGRRGEFFGEIALLRNVPRTMSVRAATNVRLLALEREPFLAAITGNPRSSLAAEQAVSRYGKSRE